LHLQDLDRKAFADSIILTDFVADDSTLFEPNRTRFILLTAIHGSIASAAKCCSNVLSIAKFLYFWFGRAYQ
jgi:hypothetical protein